MSASAAHAAGTSAEEGMAPELQQAEMGQAYGHQGDHVTHTDAATVPNNTHVSADDSIARDLQHAEMGQVIVPPVVQAAHAPARPVVQGIPLAGVPLQQPRRDNFIHGAGGQLSPVVVPCAGPPEEVVLMNYRVAIMCFSLLDVITTSLHVLHELLTVHEPHVERVIAFATAILLVGPMCGYIGAKVLNRALIGVYLFFCILELARAIYLMIVFPFFLWLVFGLLFQVWLTKIVGTFFATLGSVSTSRRRELLTEKQVQGHVVYW